MEVRQECLIGVGNNASSRQIDMQQVDSILKRYPGPVTLYVSRGRTLVGLALCLGFAAFFAWLLFADDPETRGYISDSYGTIMAWTSIVGFGALAIRCVFLLLFPSAASLTLDAHGFEIGQVFHRIRVPWRGVSDFRVETTHGRGGPLTQIFYEDLGAEAERRGAAKLTRVLPEFYGRPRLHGHEFARLMNEWRRRVLE
jgi:hypothetical protein